MRTTVVCVLFVIKESRSAHLYLQVGSLQSFFKLMLKCHNLNKLINYDKILV